MTGIVVVSHSPALAQAAVDFAMVMVHDDGPPLRIAAGTADGEVGTDAAAIAEAIGDVCDEQGAVVFCDIGSAILSAQTALEFVDPAVAERTDISPAPLVEGLIGAVVTASAGADRERVLQEADQAVEAKRQQVTG